jgi:hypothetical protein
MQVANAMSSVIVGNLVRTKSGQGIRGKLVRVSDTLLT